MRDYSNIIANELSSLVITYFDLYAQSKAYRIYSQLMRHSYQTHRSIKIKKSLNETIW